MKVSYFGYSVVNVQTGQHYLIDLRSFIDAFATHQNTEFKNRFKRFGENIYLLKSREGLYLLASTTSDEIMTKIKSDQDGIHINEIHDMLEENESFGFASYIHVERSYIAIASMYHSPKISAFCELINGVFLALSLNYEIRQHPFFHKKTTREELLSLPFVGKTEIQIEKDSSFWLDIANALGCNSSDFDDMDNFQLVMVPKRNKDIKVAVKKSLDKIPDEGLRKFVTRARERVGENLKDLFISSNSGINDTIERGSSEHVYLSIISKIGRNADLKMEVKNHEENTAFETNSIDDILRYNFLCNWPN